MAETNLASVQAAVYQYNNASWTPVDTGMSVVGLYNNPSTGLYRVVGLDSTNGSCTINSAVVFSMQYERASERFHQFTDYQDVVYGLNFASDEDATSFGSSVEQVLQELIAAQGTDTAAEDEAKRKEEEERERKKKDDEERKRKDDEEKKRKADEERRKRETDQKKKSEDEKRRKDDDDRKRKDAEDRRRRDEEERRRQEEERALETERARLAAEEERLRREEEELKREEEEREQRMREEEERLEEERRRQEEQKANSLKKAAAKPTAKPSVSVSAKSAGSVTAASKPPPQGAARASNPEFERFKQEIMAAFRDELARWKQEMIAELRPH